MSTASGLREQKKTDTRTALTRRALELAEERGYHGFTIAELVDQVGVSRRTFSNYFAGKAECLAAISDSWLDAAIELIDGTAAELPLTELIRKVVDNVTDQVAASPTGFLVMVDSEPDLLAAMSGREVAHSERIAAVISARTGMAAADIRVWLLAEFCLSAGRACTQRWVANARRGGKASLAADLDLAFSLIDFSGLSAPPRR